MKKLSITIALILMMIAPMFGNHVDEITAQKLASSFLLMKNGGEKTEIQLLDYEDQASFKNFYVFGNDHCFAIVSADDCIQPILGYSVRNAFGTETMPDNLFSWLQGYDEQIETAVKGGQKASKEIRKQWEALLSGNMPESKSTTAIAPLIQSLWSQNDYYNIFCPVTDDNRHVKAGCIATAMAQILRYWGQKPTHPITHGIGSHSYTVFAHPEYGVQTADFGQTNYDWDNMPNSLNGNSTQDEINAVATLTYHCGVSVNMKYDPSGSGANIKDAASAYNTYFYFIATLIAKSSYSLENWINTLKNELNAGRPIQYRGQSTSESHSFVCDGYDDQNNFHFNWGWAGASDGYFTINILNPAIPGDPNPDNPNHYDFSNGQAAIVGIQPASCNVSAPILELTQNENSATLSWNDVSANNYKIFWNNNMEIGSTSENSFTLENVPFGNNIYYVRSVDSDGRLSLSSNSVSITKDYPMPIVNDLQVNVTDPLQATLSWSTPEWCYPKTETATLTYGENNVRYSWNYKYYAHRHLASTMQQYSDKVLYKIATYVKYSGQYIVYIYQGTSNNKPSELMSTQALIYTGCEGWIEFVLDNPVTISSSQDLWIVIQQENTGQNNPVPSFDLSSYNTNACYCGPSTSNDPSALTGSNINYPVSWFIKAYLTDGNYTYNIYENGSKLNDEPISETNYTIDIDNNNVHLFSIKSNYYGGETLDSNKAGIVVGDANVETMTLEEQDQLTILSNSLLTVTENISSKKADNLILQDGAQLDFSSDELKATIIKHINPYTINHNVPNQDGWNFIASPIADNCTPSQVHMLTMGDYDLYWFDPTGGDNGKEWKNYKAHSDDFTLANGQGYLYGNSHDIDLKFIGTIKSSNERRKTIDNLPVGWNLVGNPFVMNTYLDRSYFVLEETASGTILTPIDKKYSIPVCTGVMVYIEDNERSITFSKEQLDRDNQGDLQITLSRNVVNRDHATSTIVDNAIVSFNDDSKLEKYVFNENDAQLYIPQGNENYAIAFSMKQGVMPINFKANENDSYTMTVIPNEVKMNYLHLIDNKEGADIDLLTSPSYTFEAKTTDYASRFKLVFVADKDDSETEEKNFAFLSNGKLILGENQNTTAQLIDLNGHIVRQEHNANTIELNGLPSGIYVVRLIGTNYNKVQKIVIE